MEYIQLKERTGLKKFGIKNPDGTDTGEYIEIDLEDFDLPIKASECQAKHVEDLEQLWVAVKEASQKSDEKLKGDVLSEKERAILEAYKEFYKSEEEALDKFMGEGATKKLLCGRKPYLTMYDDINEYLEQIIPVLKDTQKNIENRIKEKYSVVKEDNVLWVIQNMHV